MKTYLRTVSLEKRFSVVTLIVIVLLVVLAIVSLFPAYFLRSSLKDLNRDHLEINVAFLSQINKLSMGQSVLLKTMALGESSLTSAALNSLVDEQIERTVQTGTFTGKIKRSSPTDLHSALDQLTSTLFVYQKALKDVDPGKITAVAPKLDEAYANVLSSYGAFMDLRTGIESGVTTRASFIIGICSVVALSLILVAEILFNLGNKIIQETVIAPLNLLVTYFDAIAQGNLSKRIEVKTKDLIGQMGQNFNAAMERLCETIVKFSKSCVVLSFTSKDLDKNSKDLASAMDGIFEQVNPVATATEEMAATTSEIAQNCTSAATGAEQVNNLAIAGESIISQTIQSIMDINDFVKKSASMIKNLKSRSEDISNAITVIEEIASQTKILALNATTEAARAGEAGRGFAVVSNEIKKLSAQTKQATQNIQQTVEAINAETDNAVGSIEEGLEIAAKGVLEAQKSGEALKEITEQIRMLSSQISEIASASGAQSSATDEIAKNIQQISVIIKDNAENIRQNVKSATRTADLSVELKKIVGQFKFAQRKHAEDIVNKAYDYIKMHGREKALKEFNNPGGSFVHGELFIFAQDYNAVFLAYGGNPAFVGNNGYNDQDPTNGKYISREMINIARTKGSGWFEYAFKNPQTEKIADKLTFVRDADGFYIACGIYK